MRRAALVLVAVAVTVLGLCATAPSASAADFTVTVSDVDSSTPGHVTATVTTDAPGVSVSVGDLPDTANREVTTARILPVGDEHQVSVDLPTWGAVEDAFLAVATCTTATGDCGTTTRTSFVATDVAPEVTWPEDTTVGAEPAYAVTVSDPEGEDSTLRLAYDDWVSQETVPREGTTELASLPDGTYTLDLARCSAETGACAPLGVVSHRLVVNRTLDVTAEPLEHEVSPNTAPPAVHLDVDESGPVSVDWSIEGTDAAASDVPVEREGHEAFDLPIELTGVPDGKHQLDVVVTKTLPDFGDVVGEVHTRIVVDSVAPHMELKPTTTELFPAKDKLNDSMIVRFSPISGRFRIQEAQVLDSSGHAVRTFDGPIKFHQLEWRGQDDDNRALPGGRYRFEGTVADDAGNTTTDSFWFTLSRQRLVHRTFRARLQPAKVLEDQSIGACSRLATPSARGGRGSLGLYTNVACDRGFEQSLVSATFATRIPTAYEYGSLGLRTIGGAARTASRSLAYVDVLDRNQKWHRHDDRLDSHFGTHSSGYEPREYARNDGWLVWAVYTAQGASYDVQGFEVSMSYSALVGRRRPASGLSARAGRPRRRRARRSR